MASCRTQESKKKARQFGRKMGLKNLMEKLESVQYSVLAVTGAWRGN